jgi:hypothetical protein
MMKLADPRFTKTGASRCPTGASTPGRGDDAASRFRFEAKMVWATKAAPRAGITIKYVYEEAVGSFADVI